MKKRRNNNNNKKKIHHDTILFVSLNWLGVHHRAHTVTQNDDNEFCCKTFHFLLRFYFLIFFFIQNIQEKHVSSIYSREIQVGELMLALMMTASVWVKQENEHNRRGRFKRDTRFIEKIIIFRWREKKSFCDTVQYAVLHLISSSSKK